MEAVFSSFFGVEIGVKLWTGRSVAVPVDSFGITFNDVIVPVVTDFLVIVLRGAHFE